MLNCQIIFLVRDNKLYSLQVTKTIELIMCQNKTSVCKVAVAIPYKRNRTKKLYIFDTFRRSRYQSNVNQNWHFQNWWPTLH